MDITINFIIGFVSLIIGIYIGFYLCKNISIIYTHFLNAKINDWEEFRSVLEQKNVVLAMETQRLQSESQKIIEDMAITNIELKGIASLNFEHASMMYNLVVESKEILEHIEEVPPEKIENYMGKIKKFIGEIENKNMN